MGLTWRLAMRPSGANVQSSRPYVRRYPWVASSKYSYLRATHKTDQFCIRDDAQHRDGYTECNRPELYCDLVVREREKLFAELVLLLLLPFGSQERLDRFVACLYRQNIRNWLVWKRMTLEEEVPVPPYRVCTKRLGHRVTGSTKPTYLRCTP